ncbi:MAG: hypothetical protein ACJAT4_003080, partial [Granulosicoccus sp.]
MKNYQETDRIIKEKMEQHSMETPMHLFAGIAEALDADAILIPAPEKNSWRSRVWFLALLVFVVGGSGVWFLTSADNSSNEADAKMSITLNSNDVKTDFAKIENGSIATINEEASNSKSEVNNSTINNRKKVANKKNETSSSTLNSSTVSSLEKSKVGETEIGIQANSNSIANSTFETTTPKNILTQKGGMSEVNTSSNLSISNLSN